MELPLFPLNSVLFPGMPLQLHIFEDRYKKMINYCIDNQKPFGVVLIQNGRAEGAPIAKPHRIGTTAHITKVERLPHERLNIMVVGRDRFKINELDLTSHAYLTGDVDLLPFDNNDTTVLRSGHLKLRPLLEKYLLALVEAGQAEFDIAQLPDKPLSLAFLSAVLLQADDSIKQNILESEDSHALFTQLLRIYQKEVALIKILLSPPQLEEDADFPFSLN
ncbi:MAG: LON peptidase substrate-binding domain-containing protein [Phototrophicaceae bacterium]